MLTRVSEIGERGPTNEHRIGWIRWTKGILDETGMAPLRDYIPSPGMFRDDGTIFLIFLHGSTRSPLIGNRCAFNLPAPPHPRLGFLHRLPRVFSDIFAMYFTFHGKLTRTRRGEDSCTSRPRNYDALSEMENGGVIHHRIERSWNRLELAWFNFAFQLRDLFVPFWILKHLDRIQPSDREKRNEISIRPGNDDEFKRCCHWGNIVRGNWLEWNNINLEFKQLYY